MKVWLCARYARYSERGGWGRAPSSNMTGASRSRRMAWRAAARSGASSCRVELTKTRSRWSGVRMTAESARTSGTQPTSCVVHVPVAEHALGRDGRDQARRGEGQADAQGVQVVHG